jgi:hypothetical protein
LSDDLGERAAIREFDGHLPSILAEALAVADLAESRSGSGGIQALADGSFAVRSQGEPNAYHIVNPSSPRCT